MKRAVIFQNLRGGHETRGSAGQDYDTGVRNSLNGVVYKKELYNSSRISRPGRMPAAA